MYDQLWHGSLKVGPLTYACKGSCWQAGLVYLPPALVVRLWKRLSVCLIVSALTVELHHFPKVLTVVQMKLIGRRDTASETPKVQQHLAFFFFEFKMLIKRKEKEINKTNVNVFATARICLFVVSHCSDWVVKITADLWRVKILLLLLYRGQHYLASNFPLQNDFKTGAVSLCQLAGNWLSDMFDVRYVVHIVACQAHPALVKWSRVTRFSVNVSQLVHLRNSSPSLTD